MTEDTAKISAAEAAGRAMVARTRFEKEAVWLPVLAVNHWNAGEMVIAGKTFTDCVIEGPAVMAVMNGTTFDSCNMGAAANPRNLLLKPLRPLQLTILQTLMTCSRLSKPASTRPLRAKPPPPVPARQSHR